MDSITQIALGAAVGEAVLGKKVGNKAVLWGAVAGTIPDLDVIPGFFMDTVARLDFHRGFSHSILFFLILAPILGTLVAKIHRQENASRWDWTRLVFWSLFTHPLLDCFTTWGTQLFWPFEYRVAFKSIFVIDPLYTLPLIVCVIWLLFKGRGSQIRRKINIIGLTLSSGYLLLTLVNKQIMNQNFENILQNQNIEYFRFTTQPTPANNVLWSGTAETKDGFYIGYHSFLDNQEDTPFLYFKKNHQLLGEMAENEKVEKLIALTNGYFIVDSSENGVTISDLRFGLINGWATESSEFVFAYNLQVPKSNTNQQLIIRQKRASINVSSAMLRQFWMRIKGT
ncbi:metal-dependent hydrolase [candidate division KSB1 bacterium]|nr:metal-dependent hydrolase [candidate division KSB1 bacterium]